MLSELSEIVVNKLSSRRLIISTAESCTGGMVAQYLTSIPGASDIFKIGSVAYENSMKEKWLGVSPETLNVYGAVSEEVCREMAIGALKNSNCDIAVSNTGFAGPMGGTSKAPVGTVFVGIATNKGVDVRTLHINGDRRYVREQTVKYTFTFIREVIDRMD